MGLHSAKEKVLGFSMRHMVAEWWKGEYGGMQFVLAPSLCLAFFTTVRPFLAAALCYHPDDSLFAVSVCSVAPRSSDSPIAVVKNEPPRRVSYAAERPTSLDRPMQQCLVLDVRLFSPPLQLPVFHVMRARKSS